MADEEILGADDALDAEVAGDSGTKSYTVQEILLEEDMKEQNPDERTGAPAMDLRHERAPPPEMRPTGAGLSASNTGPKGVKADFEEAKRNEQSMRMREAVAKERVAMAATKTFTVADPLDEERKALAKKPKDRKEKTGSDSDTDSDLDEDDEELMAKMRADRIKAIETVRGSMPLFGSYDRVSFDQLAALVKSVHELTYVVVVLYEINHLTCARLHAAFEDIAAQFPHVRFVRIRAREAIKNYAIEGVPTLLIYRGGKMIKDFVRVQQFFSEMIATAELVEFLKAGKILQETTAGLLAKPKDKSKSETEKPKIRSVTFAEQEEDDY